MSSHSGSNSARILEAGLEKMGISLSQRQQEQLLDYLELLQKWNRTFNLSGIKDPATMVSRHLLDSLSLYEFMPKAVPDNSIRQRIIDVGTGPGLPGIPLAVCFPDMDFVLLDSNGKKTRFVFQAKVALGLDNVSVENCRIEHYQSPTQIDIVISRAFSSLTEMVEKTRHLHQQPTTDLRWLAMKGLAPAAEIAELPEGVRVQRTLRVHIPGDPGERHIIDMITADPESKASD
jgi:16S rRNA (guanine527-N7)-methyltransferase